jgi:hypothetical protein
MQLSFVLLAMIPMGAFLAVGGACFLAFGLQYMFMSSDKDEDRKSKAPGFGYAALGGLGGMALGGLIYWLTRESVSVCDIEPGKAMGPRPDHGVRLGIGPAGLGAVF